MKPDKLSWLAAIFLLALAWPSLASADCSAAQRKTADRQLWLNARDRGLVTDMVFPWGVPAEQATTNQRRLVQRDYVIEYDDDHRPSGHAGNL